MIIDFGKPSEILLGEMTSVTTDSLFPYYKGGTQFWPAFEQN